MFDVFFVYSGFRGFVHRFYGALFFDVKHNLLTFLVSFKPCPANFDSYSKPALVVKDSKLSLVLNVFLVITS